jgi:hypothetical protein
MVNGPYDDVDPQDIDPETGLPYENYSSPSLDTSEHDYEMDAGYDERPGPGYVYRDYPGQGEEE